jgi:hypothetical protein
LPTLPPATALYGPPTAASADRFTRTTAPPIELGLCELVDVRLQHRRQPFRRSHGDALR